MDPLDQFVQSAGRGRSVRVHVPNYIRQWRQLEPFDQSAPLADGVHKLDEPDGGEFRHQALDDAARAVTASVEDHHELKLAVILVLKIASVVAKHRLDPALFVVGGNQ
jgi:hypothetical protein